jgi:hypothetical protein
LLNYQGRVAVGGQNFSGTGYFKFALVDGGSNQNVTATGTVEMKGSGVSGVTITNSGSGYLDKPEVKLQGTGSGASFTATVTDGSVTAISVDEPGGGYSEIPPPVLQIAPPPEDIQTTTLWTHDGSSLGLGEKEPEKGIELPVTKGLYSVLLGDPAVAGMSALDGGLFARQADLRLRVWFSTDSENFTLLTPDQRIAAVGYALMADDVKDGAITGAKIAKGAITGENISPGSIEMTQLSPALQQTLTALAIQQEANLPVVTSSPSLVGVEGTPLSYTITASGSPLGFAATGLPAGLTRSGAVVSGSLAEGSYTFSVTASNSAGTSPPLVVSVLILGSVYVDFATGEDTNTGSPALPVKTFAHGLALAAGTTPQRNLVLSTAAQSIDAMANIPAGMTVSGGRTPGSGWLRSPGNRTPLHRAAGPSAGTADIVALACGAGATLEYLDITTDNATGPGRSCVGVDMTVGAGQKITGCRITPGDGAAGIAGTNGAAGAKGVDGRNGGVVAAGIVDDILGGGSLGFGITTGPESPRRGGNGGYAGGIFGGSLVPATAGSAEAGGGSAGAAGVNGGVVASNGSPGGNGSAGTVGNHGLAGANGTNGSNGRPGGGGGGGGRAGDFISGGPGGGGGEGGGGGLGGKGGTAGKNGGWSIAVRIIHESEAAWVAPVLTDNELRPRNGGAGGNGGSGGAGGVRGSGGIGVIRPGINGYQSGHGGGGGLGGAGGPGGGGGGGKGGSCYGIFAQQFAVVNNVIIGLITPEVTLNGVTTYSFGTPGAGGIGGLRGGSTSSRAATGNAGVTANFDPPTP